ncbi:MAG: NAD(P)H oxidoreductase, partial [Gemmatimonadetes bacterium]|nr:NAD(P)H oxidoreductase [Gemmatimonadota bacterium]
FAHPAYHRSRINRRLIEAVQDLPGVTFQDLYESYPDFNVDVAAEQQALREHDVLIYHHPFYWYNAPALLKEWQDLVLEHGFAYGDGGDVLHGKQLLTVTTTGGGAGAYGPEGINRFPMRELLTPFEQTANFCGMTYLPPFVVHGVLQEDEATFQDAAEQYRACLEGLRDESLDLSGLKQGSYLTDALAPAPVDATRTALTGDGIDAR